jgi:hypothetical protein
VQLDLFKNYKPDVNIVYYDEYHHLLTPRLMNMRTGSESNGGSCAAGFVQELQA